MQTVERDHLWAIVLAAGKGMRMASLTRALYGADRPKQFASLGADRTFLQTTLDRIAPTIPPTRTVVVVGEAHEAIAREQLAEHHGVTIVAQPADRGTGPGILLPLAHVMARDPYAAVVVFPSDHHIQRPEVFLDAVASALRAATTCPTEVALVGATADRPATDLGWIVPDMGASQPTASGWPVKSFVEKPASKRAAALLAQGALWNTLVVAGGAQAVLRLLEDHIPSQSRAFERYRAAIGSSRERVVLKTAYCRLRPADFSRRVLQRARGLGVVAMADAGWSDCGTPERLLECLRGTPQFDNLVARLEEAIARSRRSVQLVESESSSTIFDVEGLLGLLASASVSPAPAVA